MLTNTSCSSASLVSEDCIGDSKVDVASSSAMSKPENRDEAKTACCVLPRIELRRSERSQRRRVSLPIEVAFVPSE